MRKLRQFFLTTLVLLSSALTSWAEPYSGTPSASLTKIDGDYDTYGLTEEFDGYYVISSAEDLYCFADSVNGGKNSINAVLTADIVVNENVLKANGTLNGKPTYSWTPIGTSSKNYKGTFDGNGHTVSGLYFSNATNSNYPAGGTNVGLIGYAYGATIKNVGVVDSYLYGYQYVGGICGYDYFGTQTNCYNTGTVSGYSARVGGICGYDYFGTQTNCYNTGTVSSSEYVGGICGYNGTQTNCYNTGTVSGWGSSSYVGGICGSDGTQTNCYYLVGCGSKNTRGAYATAEEFASGKIAYLLNGSTSEGNLLWYQPLGDGNDAHPVLDNTHSVVYATQPCHSFCNDANNTHKDHSSMDAIGCCSDCGQFMAQEPTLVTESNYSSLNLSADFVGYYAISNSGQLYWFANEVNNSTATINALLTADIVVNENVLKVDGTLNGTPTYSWTPIGTSSNSFKGTFDGNGHTISGLYFENTTNSNYPNGGNYVGLIGYADGAAIKNVGVVDSYLRGCQYVGGICGCGYNSTTITNCYNTGAVSSGSGTYVGGICGSSGTQTNCYNTGKVSGSGSNVGGICGYGGTQTNCYYRAGCAKDGNNVVQYGVGNGTKGKTTADVAGKTISATAEEFASGKIGYLLNSGENTAWRQTLGSDAAPVLDASHDVVYATQPCPSFSNDANNTHKEHSLNDVTGYCTACRQFTVQGTLVTESNCSSLNLSADFVGYYAISNSGQLYWFANEVNNGNATINAVLTADIVVNENVLNDDGTLNGTPTYSWTPIGTSSKNYKGTFDGNGHTVSGLYFSNTTNSAYPNGGNYVGLIGYANGATIKNVGVIDSYLRGYQYVGGICGYGYNTNTNITNCYNTGSVSGSSYYVGGICGYYGTQTNCYNTGTVSGYSDVGGICGYRGTQTNCYNTGTVSGSGSNVGGICGRDGTQTNCYYLAGCGSKNTLGVSVTAEEFASGKVTYLLNGSTSEGNLAWYQTIGTDALPVCDNTHGVVYATQPCHSFSNDANNTHKDHSSNDVTGHCSACGQFLDKATLVTESNHSGLNLTADFVGYYAISNSAELYWFANEVNNGNATINAVLTADIVVNENVLKADGTLNGTPTYSWTPIGTLSNSFKGTFDGNGHTISGLYFNNAASGNYPDGGNYVGLIGRVYRETKVIIKNVGLIDSYIRGYSTIGGICGLGGLYTEIINCYNTGTVSGSSAVGGICGYVQYGTQITNCYNTGTVSGGDYVGGICSYTRDMVFINNCYNTGTVSGSSYVGGIFSYCGGDDNYAVERTINNCFNTGTVSGSFWVGGICGYDNEGSITNCYNTGTVSGSSYVGGICGENVIQTNCYYLEGCGSKNTFGVSATAEEFASGKIGYLLNANNNNAWYQDLYSDEYPLLDNTHNLVSGYIEEEGDTYTVVGEMFLATNYEVAEGKTLNVPAGTSLTTTGNAVITNNGTIICNGTLAGNNLAGNGTFITNRLSLCSISNLNESYVYKGSAYTLEDGLSGVAVNTTILGKTFTLDATISPSYTDNRYVGTATISWKNNADENDVLSGQFEITPKTLAISNIAAANKTYDGNTATTVNYTADVFSGDDVTFGTAAAFADKNAGNGKTVSFSYTKSGADAANYAFANATGETTATIEPLELVISSVSAAGKEYDGNTATTVTIAASNIVSGDVVTFGTAAAFADKNVGTNKTVNFTYTKSGADAANYKFAQANGTATAAITARSLTLSNFVAADKVYDGTVAGSGSFSDDRVSGDELEFSYTVEFDDENVVESGNSVSFSNIAISGGADKGNYSLATLTGSAAANITPVTDEVAITITLADKSVVYSGAEQTYSATEARTIEADNALYNLDWVSESGNAASVSGTNVGEYAFGWNAAMFSNSSPNFSNVTFNVTDGKLTITPNTEVVVTVTENSSAVTYNGDEQSVSGYTVSISDATGVYTEDDFAFSGNAVAAGTAAGEYAMQLSAADFSNTNPNFADVEFVIVDGALTINKAPEAPNKPEAAMETRYIVTQLVALPENWKWADEQQALVEGNNTATANYTGTDKGNYVNESVDITITRLECLHNEGNELLYTLEPTCTHKGYTGNLSCKLCGEIYEYGDSIPALGHDFVETVIAPTCTTDGYTEHLCNRCQHIEYSDTVAATGHKADSVVFENVVAATCTVAGSYDSVVYCSVCKIELSRDAVDVAAAGHKADSVLFENIVSSTCTIAGSYDSVVYCSVCHIELSRDSISLPATGHKADSIVFENIVAATCTVAGSKDSVVYCSVCKAELSRTKIEIPATGHTVVVDSAVAATATETGLTEGSHCSVCHETIVAQEVIPALGEQGGNENQGGGNGNENNNEPATAVSEEAITAVNIYATGNTIVVENATDEIFVYNVMGGLVARGTETTITVNHTGVYIVKTGTTAKRVMINQ